MPGSLIRQFEQIRGTYDFVDDMYRAYAEQAGRHYEIGTVSTVSGLNTVVASSSFGLDEVGNFIIIDSGVSSGVYEVLTVSGTSATVTPTVSGTSIDVSYRRHYYQNLEDDLNYLRRMVTLIIGDNNWYDNPQTNLYDLATATTASGISTFTDNFNGVLSPSDYNVQKALDTIDDIKFFQTISNSVTSFDADTNADTLTFSGTGGTSILTEASTNTVIIHSSSGGYGHPHLHYNIDLHYLFGDTWATSGTGLLLLPDDLEVFVNGIKQRADSSEYYTPSISGGNLYVEFGFNVSDDNWVNSSYDVEYFVPMHLHHDVDMVYVSNSVWAYDGGFYTAPSGIVLFVNGRKQKNDPAYYVPTISGTSLVVDFSFSVEASSWVNLEYTTV